MEFSINDQKNVLVIVGGLNQFIDQTIKDYESKGAIRNAFDAVLEQEYGENRCNVL